MIEDKDHIQYDTKIPCGIDFVFLVFLYDKYNLEEFSLGLYSFLDCFKVN